MDHHERLDPDTAPKDRSIWKSIDRATLERQTKALCDKQHVAGRRFYGEPSYRKDDRSYPLPFELEKSLADDFAFIAAFQPQVDSISAAAIEQNESAPLFKVKLAANEGISPGVKRTFNDLFEVLRKHARKDIMRDDCQAQLFELIVKLNCNKILGRLGSTRFQPPTHITGTREPLPTRLRQLYRNHVQASLSSRNRPDVDRLDGQIGSFEAAFRRLEEGKSEELIPNVKDAIKQAFDLTKDGVKLPNRLKNLGCPNSLLDARDVREVGKVSNYWRISHHLAVCSQWFRRLFANAEWYPLVKYRASFKSQIITQQFVHAEIQLLVHYELISPPLIPRAIGASKEACFLCDSFIRAHGRFSITGAHRQTFCQWTVPDLKEYDWQTIRHFRRALSQVCVEVKKEYLKAQIKLPWRPYPLQSAINLNVVQLKTPSTSSLLSQPGSHSSDDTRTIKTSSSSTASTLRQVKQSLSLVGTSGDGEAFRGVPSRLSPIDEQQVLIYGREQAHVERPIEIIVDDVVSAHRDWVQISASFSGSPSIELATSQRQQFNGGSVFFESSLDGECQRIVNLADIPSKEELVLDRDSNDVLGELSFVLVGTQDQKVRIRCRWHG